MQIKFIICLLFFLSISSCNKDTISSINHCRPGFEFIPSDSSGVNFINALEDNPLTEKNVLSFEYYFHGAGLAIVDLNNDSLPDIFFSGNEVRNEIFINKGGFKFEKLPPGSGINKNKVWSSGASIVDINQDGYMDIYVCQQGPYEEAQRKNCFYINNGDLTFSESAQKMGLDDSNYSTQAAFFDYDKDGDLDCYVMNESKYVSINLKSIYKDLENEDNMRAASGRLFENVGNMKFKDVTKESNLLKYGYGLGLCISDINGDNWPDIYVTNDYSIPDFLFINQKNGKFKESIKEYTRQISYFGMGCDIADINNDTYVDIGVVDMASEDHFRDKTLMAGMDSDAFKYYFYNKSYQFQYMFNSLQLNNRNNTFSNIASLSGVLKSDWSWAALFCDVNLDGHKDYYITNGFRRYLRDNDFLVKIKEIRSNNNNSVPRYLRKDVYALMPEIKIKNKIYINDGDLHFDQGDSIFTHPNIDTYSYGAAYGDLDNDGDMDIVISNIDQYPTLLRNTSRESTKNHYIKIRLSENNPSDKLGAKVYVTTMHKTQYQEYYFVRGYESCMEEVLIFGLGNEDRILEIKITWPDGTNQFLSNLDVDQTIYIEKAENSSDSLAKINKAPSILREVSSFNLGLNFKHQENYFDDFEKEVLLPQKQTSFGPGLAVGDVNIDGLDDFYAGGAKGQTGVLYLQTNNGTFIKAPSQPWTNEKLSEDVDALFIDPNQDGALDLLILSGGSGDMVGSENYLANRFYANNGKGEFFRIANIIPTSLTASFAVVAQNIDNDPQQELLIIGAAQPGRYPMSERTVLLDYRDNQYIDITSTSIPELNKEKGLIRSAVWVDLNIDGRMDLITVGEWQDIRVYIQSADNTFDYTAEWTTKNKKGWWRSIATADLDNDGDMDIIVGNVGKNFKQKASPEHPLYLYYSDYDGNGTLDCVLAKNYNDKIVPARGRQCSSEQMPFISKKFKTYNEFASASIDEILGKENINNGTKLQAEDFYSYILWNQGGKFDYQKLPPLAQVSPINDMIIEDFDEDGTLDVFIIGNDYNTEYETPRLDAGNGLILIQTTDKKFEALSVIESGIHSPNDSKKLRSIEINGKQHYIVGVNNDSLEFYSR